MVWSCLAHCWCHFGLRVAKLIASQEESFADPRLRTGIIQKDHVGTLVSVLSEYWSQMSDETFLSTVFTVTVPQLPDEKKKSSYQMLNVMRHHLKERWRFATAFLFFFSQWFLNTWLQLPFVGRPFAWLDTAFTHLWKHEHHRRTAVTFVSFFFTLSLRWTGA